MLKNKTILITGGTGSFGKKFVTETLKKYNPKKIIIYSRDEIKQFLMSEELQNDKLKFVIGDVRDKERIVSASKGVDYIVHAAATKIVPIAEFNPSECIKTNIFGAMNVIEAATNNNVKKVIALSTDKASSPVNLYGATKLASDKLFISNNFSDSSKTIFSVVRYGNVIGSRGSVVPFFMNFKNSHNYIPITDREMTRFMITIEEAVDLVWLALKDSLGGETYVKKIPSMNILDIANAVAPENKIKIVGIRPGEKIHEQMIGVEDAPNTYEYKSYYKIVPDHSKKINNLNYKKNGKQVNKNFIYRSDLNNKWMDVLSLKKIIKKKFDL